jgi:NAD(P)H-hydrate epimerase
MSAVLTKAEMQALDRRAIEELGIPGMVLMEVAGRAVADRAGARARGRRVLAIAGLGNNGGDAVVAARHLFDRGVPVDIALAGARERVSPDLEKQLQIAKQLGLEPLSLEGAELPALFGKYAVAIDGLFGLGLSRAIDGLSKAIIEALNDSALEIVAIDMPSGIDADNGQILGSAVRATETVTFQHKKLGHVFFPGREHTGILHVADIGIPRILLNGTQALEVGDETIARALPARKRDAHKGTFGHLLIIAGVPDRPGSALLAGRAALRIGAGLVTIGSDGETIRRIAPALGEMMGASIGRDEAIILDELATKSALAIGPSLPPDGPTRALLMELLPRAEVPIVADAGALGAIGAQLEKISERRAPLILTPHPKEAAVLLGLDTKTIQSDRKKYALELATKAKAIVVLKGASTVIADAEGRVRVVLAGNPGMASGGTGDVLTGIIGGLLAQRVDPFDAACAGVLLHGRAGDRAAAQHGEARLIASDLIEHLALREDGVA